MTIAPPGAVEVDPDLRGIEDQLSELRRFATTLLGSDVVDVGMAGVTVEVMEVACLQLERRLADEVDPGTGAVIAELLLETSELQGTLRKAAVDGRFSTLRTIHESLARVRRARTLPDLVRLAASEACLACGFERVVISEVRGSTWTPWVAHEAARLGGNPEMGELTSLEIPLRAPLPEAELARRGDGLLVAGAAHDAKTHARFVGLLDADSYVVVPVPVGGRTVGFLHGCVSSGGRSLCAADVDSARSFAAGLGLAVEALVLSERLETQRRRVIDVFEAAASTAADLCVRDVRLPASRGDVDVDGERPTGLDDRTTDATRVQAIFTPKEREVLRQMVAGATNAEIAARLVVCDSTVKSHVKHILRKLGAHTRSEAVCRYVKLVEDDRAAA